jgi:3-oxoadipate enol-lactonase
MPTLAVGGVELYHEIHGAAGLPTVVFVNGIFQDTTAWSPHAHRLSARYRCVLYDCRGQGRSADPAGPHLIERHVSDLIGLLDALGIARPHLVGLSNGGAVAMTLAATRPERVGALVLADTFAHADGALRAKVRSWRAALDAGGPGLRFDVSVPWNFSAAFLDAHEHDLGGLRERALSLRPEAMRSLMEGTMRHDARALLPQIRAPTLVLVGEHDVLSPPWVMRAIADAIHDARLVIVPGAGHALPIEKVDDFCGAIDGFFASVRL